MDDTPGTEAKSALKKLMKPEEGTSAEAPAAAQTGKQSKSEEGKVNEVKILSAADEGISAGKKKKAEEGDAENPEDKIKEKLMKKKLQQKKDRRKSEDKSSPKNALQNYI